MWVEEEGSVRFGAWYAWWKKIHDLKVVR